MNNYQIKITLLSDTLIGSGEGYGAIIDTDIIHDNFGLPYIPGKRIKGILLESAEMLNAMFSNLNYSIPIKEIFGSVGEVSGQMQINNLYIEQYDEIIKWLSFLKYKSKSNSEPFLLNKQRVLNQLTSIRHSTAINSDTGIAKEHSLRTIRVINKGLIFFGDIEIESANEEYLALMCQNIRRIGTNRNRGLGEVKVELFKDNQNLCEIALEKLKTENVL